MSYNELVMEVLDYAIQDSGLEFVNASSIDVRLGNEFLIERNPHPAGPREISLRNREAMETKEWHARDVDQLELRPGSFVLAQTKEWFNLPLNMSAEFRLKSSAARMGLSHALAVWCDPGWHGSALTLELHNVSRYHTIILQPGDRIGQMIFHRHLEVPEEQSYAVNGAYNRDMLTSGAKPPTIKPSNNDK